MKTSSGPTDQMPGPAGLARDRPLEYPPEIQSVPVQIPVDSVILAGDLAIPAGAVGIVLFAHGSGSSRHSPRNQHVAEAIQEAGLATLLFDLLTTEEEEEDEQDGPWRFDIQMLSQRLATAARWIGSHEPTQDLSIGFFGASTGGAAALVAATKLGDAVEAIVSRGGRPDLAGAALKMVNAPTLLIVGGRDELVHELNQEAYDQLPGKKQLVVVPHATHLFEEPGALDHVAALAAAWFSEHLKNPARLRRGEAGD